MNSFGQKNVESAGVIPNKINRKPNVIFILTDDQRWDALGAMGNSTIITPNLDKLAIAGILFQNAYVTTSICAISRASILTGQYQSRHKINDFKTDLDSEAFPRTYPILLKGYGYKIGFIGKFGVGDHPPGQLFDFWRNISPEYIINGKPGRKIHNTDTVNNAIQEFLDYFGRDAPFCLSISFKAPHEEDGDPPAYIIQPKYKDYYKNVTIPNQ